MAILLDKQVVYCVSNSLSIRLLIECELAIKYLHNFDWKLLIEATSLSKEAKPGQPGSFRIISGLWLHAYTAPVILLYIRNLASAPRDSLALCLLRLSNFWDFIPIL